MTIGGTASSRQHDCQESTIPKIPMARPDLFGYWGCCRHLVCRSYSELACSDNRWLGRGYCERVVLLLVEANTGEPKPQVIGITRTQGTAGPVNV